MRIVKGEELGGSRRNNEAGSKCSKSPRSAMYAVEHRKGTKLGFRTKTLLLLQPCPFGNRRWSMPCMSENSIPDYHTRHKQTGPSLLSPRLLPSPLPSPTPVESCARQARCYFLKNPFRSPCADIFLTTAARFSAAVWAGGADLAVRVSETRVGRKWRGRRERFSERERLGKGRRRTGLGGSVVDLHVVVGEEGLVELKVDDGREERV